VSTLATRRQTERWCSHCHGHRTDSYANVLVAAVVVLAGAATMGGGAVAADPNQDDQFLALLDKEEIPAVENVPTVIAAGHTVCRRLDSGMPVDDIVDAMRNDAYAINPRMRLHRARITTTMTRFVIAAVETYCPYDQSKIAAITANPEPGSNELAHRVAVYPHNAVNSGTDLPEPPALDMMGRCRDDRSGCDVYGAVLASLTEAVPAGEIPLPNPPQIPIPPLPTAQIRTPPRTIAAPAPPQQQPPPAPEVKPPPEQVKPPPEQPAPEVKPPPEQVKPPPEQPAPEVKPPPQQQPPPAPEVKPPPEQVKPPPEQPVPEVKPPPEQVKPPPEQPAPEVKPPPQQPPPSRRPHLPGFVKLAP
jgi:hypothetical protein